MDTDTAGAAPVKKAGFMPALHRFLTPVVDTKTFNRLFGVIMFVNPVGLFPQLWNAVYASSVVGIATETYTTLGILQVMLMLHGIKDEDWRLFLAFLLSCTQSFAIILIVLWRGGTWFGLGF